jgi:tetrahydromethanopterin S-methyltransferase subunit B
MNTVEEKNFIEFDKILLNIDNNIKKLNNNFNNIDPQILPNTNNLISSASLILAKLSENNNISDILEKKYNDLNEKKKIISKFTDEYQIKLLNDLDKNDEENSNLLNNNNNINNINNNYELGLITDYNEKLLQDSMHNLNEINDNLQATANNLINQGDSIQISKNKLDNGEKKVDDISKKLNQIKWSKYWGKISLIIINILLTIIILLIIIIKMLNFIKS